MEISLLLPCHLTSGCKVLWTSVHNNFSIHNFISVHDELIGLILFLLSGISRIPLHNVVKHRIPFITVVLKPPPAPPPKSRKTLQGILPLSNLLKSRWLFPLSDDKDSNTHCNDKDQSTAHQSEYECKVGFVFRLSRLFTHNVYWWIGGVIGNNRGCSFFWCRLLCWRYDW